MPIGDSLPGLSMNRTCCESGDQKGCVQQPSVVSWIAWGSGVGVAVGTCVGVGVGVGVELAVTVEVGDGAIVAVGEGIACAETCEDAVGVSAT